MKFRRPRNQLLIEPPSAATGDIAFNLIVFFLICASTQPDSGRAQTLPRAEQSKQQENNKNIEVALTRDAFLLDGVAVKATDLRAKLVQRFAGKQRQEERIVVLKSDKSTKYDHWMTASVAIEQAGGIITIQREETKVQTVP
ncbi:MAG TPA: biopolymer transporter ExbD [Pirellulaceae bacterium]|nr:biopolymer transporter ExbD [Pirellulaceae bacterium]